MSETARFALIITVTGAIALAAVLVNRLSARLRLPAPVWMLAAAAIAVFLVPGVPAPRDETVQQVVSVALVLILFNGGRHIGWARLRPALGLIIVVGVFGTFLTAAGGGVLMHAAFGLAWYVALLVATAVSPTDPAVVFSVLGQQEIAGRSGTILEGESGANDPVGIALMAGLLAAGGVSGAAFGGVAVDFVLQMTIGVAAGVAGGMALLWFMRRVSLPSEALYPLRTLASVLLLYGATTLLHGSGFLAVFVAGIVIGDRRAPYQREIERFHAALAGLAEIVAFVVLGLTIDLTVLARMDVWLPGLILGVALAVVIRPLFVGLCLLPAQLERGERAFVLFAGLKGAVPILLGDLLLTADVPTPSGSTASSCRGDLLRRGPGQPGAHRRAAFGRTDAASQAGAMDGRASGCRPNRTLPIRSSCGRDLSSTAVPSPRSPSWRATSGSAWWYGMGVLLPVARRH